MRVVEASQLFEGTVHEAEALWYDTARWPGWVVGLAQVEGVQTMQAQARQGSARITCTFDLSRDVDLALQDVQAKVAQTQRSLPTDVPAATVSTPIVGNYPKTLLEEEQHLCIPIVG